MFAKQRMKKKMISRNFYGVVLGCITRWYLDHASKRKYVIGTEQNNGNTLDFRRLGVHLENYMIIWFWISLPLRMCQGRSTAVRRARSYTMW